MRPCDQQGAWVPTENPKGKRGRKEGRMTGREKGKRRKGMHHPPTSLRLRASKLVHLKASLFLALSLSKQPTKASRCPFACGAKAPLRRFRVPTPAAPRPFISIYQSIMTGRPRLPSPPLVILACLSFFCPFPPSRLPYMEPHASVLFVPVVDHHPQITDAMGVLLLLLPPLAVCCCLHSPLHPAPVISSFIPLM